MKVIRNNFWICVFATYFISVFFVFGKLTSTFFQQDEWAIFGNYLYWQKAHLNWIERLFTYGQYTHLIPLSNIYSFAQFKLFGLQFYPYALSSIVLHFINSFLVFLLANSLFKKNILAFLAGFFFLVNSISHQATTWIATASGTQGAVFFLLLCLIFFTKYLFGNVREKKYLHLSLLFFTASLFFKETSIFIFLFLPLYGLIIGSNKNKEIAVSLLILGVFYFSLRAIIPFVAIQPAPAIPELAQPSSSVYLYRSVTMPLKILTQSIVPVEYLIKASNILIKTAYPQFIAVDQSPNPYIAESVSSDIVMYCFATIALLGSYGLYVFYKKKKEDLQARVLMVSIIFIGLSSLPFIFIPGRAGFLSLLDGRHLYLTGIFTAIAMSSVFYGLYKIFHQKNVILFSLVVIFICFSALNISKIKNDIFNQVAIGQLREGLLNEISGKYQHLSNRIVFYIPSDKSFYGVEGNILPFQSGVGQTILVWYNIHGENFPSCFFNDQFLYIQLSQGYRECEGRGFGYFREQDKLESFMKENKIKENEIIAYQYISSGEKLIDITKKIQAKIL